MTKPRTLYQKLVEAELKNCLDHHESDLYVRVNDSTTAILLEHFPPISIDLDNTGRSRWEMFHDDRGVAWFDIPFAYDPFWYWGA